MKKVKSYIRTTGFWIYKTFKKKSCTLYTKYCE